MSAVTPLMPVTVTVNGRGRTLTVEPRTTLLEALREHLGLTDNGDILSETIVVASYLADQHPEASLIPRPGLERAKFDQLLVFTATEIAQKHIPLMHKLMTPFG